MIAIKKNDNSAKHASPAPLQWTETQKRDTDIFQRARYCEHERTIKLEETR